MLMLRASIGGAFFVYGLILTSPAYAGSCDEGLSRSDADIRYVHDGDTVFLTDGRKLRLVGLDTPELARDERPAEPFAVLARDELRRLVGELTGVHLLFDAERRDRYGRLLAHVLLEDGRNITRIMLMRGLAVMLIVPPNHLNTECYQAAERYARERRLGIWQLPGFQAIPSESLTPSDRGYRIVTGRIVRIGHGGTFVWLNLAGGLALRIAAADLGTFKSLNLEGLLGQTIEARGYLTQRHGELRMRIRHPYALTVHPDY
ncbi:MAG: hypothetical protein BMS9Abin15_0935 [Gammaproteobacteria bacterium]|nr:MAG: hypothetical protein BMS9Abin15_0935 [Gammaproteobacteria bacterium]